jgi:hypothetical protein
MHMDRVLPNDSPALAPGHHSDAVQDVRLASSAALEAGMRAPLGKSAKKFDIEAVRFFILLLKPARRNPRAAATNGKGPIVMIGPRHPVF